VKVAGWLPRETTTLLRLDGEGRPLLLYTYGRQHNVENQPPEVLALSPNAALPKASTPAPAAAAVPADSPQPPVPTLVPAGYAGSPFGDRRNPMAPQRIPGRLQCEEQGPGGLELELTLGLHLVRVQFLAGNTNLDYLEFRAQ